MQKYKIEFTYNKKKDKTNIYIWLGQLLKDVRELNDQISYDNEKKIRKSIQLELIEE